MSLRETLFGKPESLRNKLAGAAVAAAGAVSRSTSTVSKGVEMMTGKKPEAAPTPKPFDPKTDPESTNQREVARISGYASDELGNRTSRLPLTERLEIAKTNPGTINELLNEEERKLVNVEVKEDKNIFDTVKRKLTGKEKETTVTVPYEPRVVQIEGVQTVEEADLKRVPAFYPDDVKKEFVLAAKENNYDTARLSAQMESEMGWYEPDYVKKDEGAVGQGQHRDIFYKDINPEFKAKYGHDYDRKNPKDVFRATSLAMNKYMKRFGGSWEAALIAYNKGPDVVQQYIDDPNYTFDDDPYVQGVKEKLSNYQ
jgi:hypothetical protein